jgi:hypothetical protein
LNLLSGDKERHALTPYPYATTSVSDSCHADNINAKCPAIKESVSFVQMMLRNYVDVENPPRLSLAM